MSHYNNKYKYFITKLNVKTKHNQDIKKYEWLRANYEYEVSQAIVSHQHLQKIKDADIHLHKMDIQVHEAHLSIFKKKADTLCLKIQFHQMM